MKTNYDHLIEGGIDALIGKNFSGADCECCVCLVGEDCVYSGEECARAIKQWLESEYVEPDTQERINEDVNRFACDYFGNKPHADCDDCPIQEFYGIRRCESTKILDLLARQRRLDGVEK